MRAQKRKRQYRKENQFLELRLEKILDLIYPAGLLTWRYRVFGMKLHLPAVVPPHPHGGDIRIAGQRAGATSGRLGSVINESGNIGSEELDLRVKNLDWSESADRMKSFDECEDLIPAPNLLFDTSKVAHKQL